MYSISKRRILTYRAAQLGSDFLPVRLAQDCIFLYFSLVLSSLDPQIKTKPKLGGIRNDISS